VAKGKAGQNPVWFPRFFDDKHLELLQLPGGQWPSRPRLLDAFVEDATVWALVELMRLGVPESDAKDVAQEMLLTLSKWIAFKYYPGNGPDKLRYEMRKKLGGCKTSWWRKKKNIRTNSLPPDLNGSQVPYCSSSQPPSIEATIRRIMLDDAIKDLPANQRNVVELRLDNDSFESIAKKMQISRASARQLYHRAKRKLRKILQSSMDSQVALP
jgi:RNA polymerase sigma factor (sigma-70 family)